MQETVRKDKHNLLLVIVGPTAAGKTNIGIEVALKIGGEVVSADSMQVYRLMNIGTAKPTLAARKGVSHHLIDVVWPDEPYSVAQYQEQAFEVIRDCHIRGVIPILVGGTGLYIDAVTKSYHFMELQTDWRLRRQLQEEAKQLGSHALHKRLMEVDPQTALRIHPNDLRRIIRGLEVYMRTGKPRSYYDEQRTAQDFETVFVGLTRTRPDLYERIDNRVDGMVQFSLIEEVKHLLDRGYERALFSMRSLGYREIAEYLYGLSTLDEAVRLMKRNTRRYAKRQLTWFKGNKRILWINMGEITKDEAVRQVVEYLEGKLKRL